MPSLVTEIRPGAYFDSVVLMQLQRSLLGLPGVQDAGVVMATPVNLELLAASGLRPEVNPGPDDLLLVVRADTEAEGQAALRQVDELLAKRRSAVPAAEFFPKSLEAAARVLPEASWVLISVPGRFAAGVAREALRLGKNVFLYSDNIPLEDEVALKRTALVQGSLVMGPDCGTAIIGGFGFGFANRVRRGNIGLVGASGTGLQAVTSAIHSLGGGVSQAIGIGSRDLRSEVGAISARQALDVLRRDPETTVVVLVSKPPDAQVAGSLLAAARDVGKPVVADLIGLAPGGPGFDQLHFTTDLEATARRAVEIAGQPPTAMSAVSRNSSGKFLRALLSGGTLAYEAVLALQHVLHPLFTNVPISEDQRLDDPLHSRAHTVLDLGADLFTVGRLHPMIDYDLRLRRLRQEADDPSTGVILLDVVLGDGAHPDPAAELAPVIAEAVQRPGLSVVAAVVGTDSDPQGLDSQVERLRSSGAQVHTSWTEALQDVARRLDRPAESLPAPVPLEAFRSPAVINVGLETFYQTVIAQGAAAVHVDWRPPAGGDERLMGILARMKRRGSQAQAP